MSGTALFVSPHLDDVAFSCGGAMITLGDTGWRTVVVTVFTASVPAPSGFALACQLDKGLSADVDYLALRRSEDEEFAHRAGVWGLRWLDLHEAPHRGYRSADELFGPIARSDTAAEDVRAALANCLDAEQPDMVFVPQALGGHVDHRLVAEACSTLAGDAELWWYRDVPYAIGQPRARSPQQAVASMAETPFDITDALARKCEAATAYVTQLGFQFGSASGCAEALGAHAAAEARRVGRSGAAEVLRTDAARPRRWAEGTGRAL